MHALKIIGIITLLCLSNAVSAGWYECYNFKGSIDDYAITFSIQYRPGYFGASPDLNMIGVYKYDRHNTPIRTKGTWTKADGVMVVDELDGDGNSTAVFRLEESAPGVWRGTWKLTEGGRERQVELHQTSQLDDREQEYAFNGIEMLQAMSLPDYYFIGVYEKDSSPNSNAYMTALKIVRKQDGSVFQTLSFEDYFHDVGNVSTIIYDNVEQIGTDEVSNGFILWCDVGRMGGYYDVTFDAAINRFEIDPEPFIDGVGKPDPEPSNQTDIKPDITQTQPDFEPFCRAVATCLANGDIAEVNKVVHPDGVYTIYRIGVPDIFRRDLALDTNLQRTFPYYYPVVEAGQNMDQMTFRYGKLPTFDCGKYEWNEAGIFADTSTVHHQLTDIMDFLAEYEDVQYSVDEVDAMKALEANSRKVIFTPNDLIMYVTRLNGKWYLSVVDVATLDCSA